MTATKMSILSTLFIFAMVAHAWNDSDKSRSYAANRATTMKMDENKGPVQKKKKPTPKPVKRPRKGDAKSQSAHRPLNDTAAVGSSRTNMDFLKAVEDKRRARWIDLDEIIYWPDPFLSHRSNDFLISREAPGTKSSNADFGQSLSKSSQAGSSYFEKGTKLEPFRHLESKKEEVLREIFMGLRFSFSPNGRHLVLQMNVIPSSERGPGLTIPF